MASATFSHAERSRRLLQFLGQQTLDGHAETLNEYLLGVEIFNRKPTFHSETDAIVRVEAGRLRRRLPAYYEIEGRDDPVLITLPPRTYVPVFESRRSATVAVSASRRRFRSWMAWRTSVVLAFVLLLTGAVLYWSVRTRPGAATPQTPSIVVLPFSNLSSDTNQEYFCDGLTEEILETLTQVDGLRVVSRTSAFQFKGRRDDVRKIAAQLNVELVLEGSVRAEGKDLRIDVQLVNAANGYDLWSQTFERELTDAFAVQQEIARTVLGSLRSQLAREHWLRPFDAYTPSLSAHNLYLRGVHYELKWDAEGLGKAIGYLEQAVAADPKYAAAYAALAESYVFYGVYSGGDPAVMAKARAAARKALDLDSTLPNAYAAVALVKAIDEWDWAGASLEFQRAQKLEPHDSTVQEAYVMGYLVPTGRLEEALKVVEQAHDYDPVSPGTDFVIGLVHYFQRDYDQAIADFQAALEVDTAFRSAHLGLASAYENKRMYAEALHAVEESGSARESLGAKALLGHTYALMGRKAEARALAGELAEVRGAARPSPVAVAAIFAVLGEKDRAFELLERAYAQHAALLAYLKVIPSFDGLHSDGRFRSLLKRIHLE